MLSKLYKDHKFKKAYKISEEHILKTLNFINFPIKFAGLGRTFWMV